MITVQINKEFQMTIQETKAMVNTILDLNESDDKFTYAPWVSIYPDGHIIVSCMIKSRRTGEAKSVQNFRGDMFARLDEVRNEMIVSADTFIAQKKAELEAELKKLEDI